MKRFIALSFVFMGWAYYELSGGADFVPEVRPAAVASAPEAEAAPVDPPPAEVEAVAAVATAEPVPEPVIAPVPEPDIVAESPEPTGIVEQSQEDEFVFTSLAEPASDLRRVTANNLNVRIGPSTSDGVLTQLRLDEAVTVVTETDDGWSLIRLEGDGVEGWVATRFLTN